VLGRGLWRGSYAERALTWELKLESGYS
jgi:hypothetical protein